LPQQFKFVRQQITTNRELLLLAQGLQLNKSLADALSERIFIECFLSDRELPRSPQALDQLINAGRGSLDKTATQVISLMQLLFKEWRRARQLLGELQSPTFVTAVADVNAQLALLLPQGFLSDTPSAWFAHLSRYVQAIVRRLDRLRGNASRDAELSKQISPFNSAFKKLNASHSSAEIEQLKWMIEEFRVSLFAQDLKTSIPVSAKRLSDQVMLAEKKL